MMVNRSMEAKRIKYIRQAKARPRGLRMNKGYMKGGSSVDRSKVPDKYLALFAYRDRAKTFIDDFLAAKFGLKRPIEDEILAGPYTSTPKSEERDKLFATDLVSGRYTSLTMFHTSRCDCIYLVEYQRLPGILRKSITYSSHDRAMKVFQLRTIRWSEVHHIPNVEQ